MSDTPSTRVVATKPLWYRDVRVLRVIAQVIFAIVAIGLAVYLYSNFSRASAAANLPTGFGYLDGPTNFVIQDSDFRASQPVHDALRVGIRNTMAAVAVGAILMTILGVMIGIGRLSQNWLVRKSTQLYVETVRNIPPLVIIVFLFTPVIGQFPQIQEPTEVEGLFIASNRGLWLPWVNADGPGAGRFWYVVLVGTILAGAVGWWRTKVNERTGTPHHRVLWSLGVMLATLAVGYVALGAPFDVDGPLREGRNVDGGIKLSTAYAAVTFGLVIYTASHVAELVRGSIQAVPRGQAEAADALALSPFQRMRFVVLPQAFKIMVPPLASQYLNFTKNTSLAIFVGYSEITQVSFTIQGNGNPGVQTFLLLMAVYLTLSLSMSFGANAINSRLQNGVWPWWTAAVPTLYITLVWAYMGPLTKDSGGPWMLAMLAGLVAGGGNMAYRLARTRKWLSPRSAPAAAMLG